MISDPLVSIVLPTYNGERYLAQAVQSCLDQTYANWELIIVDDASTDGTPVVIDQCVAQDSRIRSVHHQTNRKLPAALNTGFSHANGEYLTWTSDDNCYRPNALTEMVALLESKPEIDVVYTDYTKIDEQACPVGRGFAGKPEDLAYHNSIGPCFLYRRYLQGRLKGYCEDCFLAEDYDFWLRASVSFRFHRLNEDLYLYRYRHSSSLTKVHCDRVNLIAERVLSVNLPHMHWMSDEQRASAYVNLSKKSKQRNKLKDALLYLLHAFSYSPSVVFVEVAGRLVTKALAGQKASERLERITKGLQKYLGFS